MMQARENALNEQKENERELGEKKKKMGHVKRRIIKIDKFYDKEWSRADVILTKKKKYSNDFA